MEELRKKLADSDQASKVQQQKLKVGQLGERVWPLDRGGKLFSKLSGRGGVGAEEGHPVFQAALLGSLWLRSPCVCLLGALKRQPGWFPSLNCLHYSSY